MNTNTQPRLAWAHMIIGLATGVMACSKKPPASVLGIFADMGCEKFAEVALPLHENYKKLRTKFDGMKPNGEIYLTKASLIDACQGNHGSDPMFLDAATDAGTMFLVQFYGPAVSFDIGLEHFFFGLFTSQGETRYVVDGESLSTRMTAKDHLDQGLKKADEELFSTTLTALGSPLIEAKRRKDADEKAQFWRNGNYVVSKNGGAGMSFFPVRYAVEKDLKDSPDVERIIDALRKDGAKGL